MSSPNRNLSSLSNLGCLRRRQVRENIVVRGGEGVDDEVCDKNVKTW